MKERDSVLRQKNLFTLVSGLNNTQVLEVNPFQYLSKVLSPIVMVMAFVLLKKLLMLAYCSLDCHSIHTLLVNRTLVVCTLIAHHFI